MLPVHQINTLSLLPESESKFSIKEFREPNCWGDVFQCIFYYVNPSELSGVCRAWERDTLLCHIQKKYGEVDQFIELLHDGYNRKVLGTTALQLLISSRNLRDVERKFIKFFEGRFSIVVLKDMQNEVPIAQKIVISMVILSMGSEAQITHELSVLFNSENYHLAITCFENLPTGVLSDAIWGQILNLLCEKGKFEGAFVVFSQILNAKDCFNGREYKTKVHWCNELLVEASKKETMKLSLIRKILECLPHRIGLLKGILCKHPTFFDTLGNISTKMNGLEESEDFLWIKKEIKELKDFIK